MEKAERCLWGLWGTLCAPTNFLAGKLHAAGGAFNVHLSRRVLHVVAGLLLMALGSTIAHFAAHLPHAGAAIAADTFAYGLHGFGAAPLVKLVAELLEIEV